MNFCFHSKSEEKYTDFKQDLKEYKSCMESDILYWNFDNYWKWQKFTVQVSGLKTKNIEDNYCYSKN